ncbi:MAG: pantoate--beta-alanine ligase [Bacteroidota bacterium]
MKEKRFYILRNINELSNWRERQANSIGFVPTMGALHSGHLSLVQTAQKNHSSVLVSIFINPTQFNDKKDLDRYPRTEENDLLLLKSIGCDAVFIPQIQDIYGHNVEAEFFDFGSLTQLWEGAFRPGHFNGVITVVKRLFSLVQPHSAYFGKKDFQQYLIISHWSKITNSAVRVVGCDTVRSADGLAMSSRNSRLSAEEKNAALAISKSLFFLRERKSIEPLKQTIEFVHAQFLNPAGVRVEYLTCANSESLVPYNEWPQSACVLLIAGWIGEVRLIDELEIV